MNLTLLWPTHRKANSDYGRLVRKGHIIVPDPLFFSVWSELLAEEGLELSREEEARRDELLFVAANELEPVLRRYRALIDQGSGANPDALRQEKAHLRVRLRRDVEILLHERAEVAKMPQPLALEALEADVTVDELAAEVEQLKAQDHPGPEATGKIEPPRSGAN